MSVEQLTLPLEEKKGRSKIQELDFHVLEAELQELAGNIKVKVQKKNNQSSRVAMYETDHKILFTINTKKIRTQKQLDDVLDFCRTGVS